MEGQIACDARESQAVTAIADALEPFVDAGDVAGLVALVARGDDVEVTVLGDQAVGGSPMREDSLFRVASAGKPLTAAAALALVADGRLTLDQPVDDLLPELARRRVLREPSAALDDTVPAVRPVTVRDLLRSTSGLGFSSDFTAPITAALLERLNQGPPRPQGFVAPDEWRTCTPPRELPKLTTPTILRGPTSRRSRQHRYPNGPSDIAHDGTTSSIEGPLFSAVHADGQVHELSHSWCRRRRSHVRAWWST